jgi:hypothetical protein
MPYTYIVRDTRLRKNAVKITSDLDAVEKTLRADKRYRRINGIRGDLFLIYFEYFPGMSAARARQRFFQTGPGKEQLQRWRKRWDKSEIAE